MTKRQRLHWDVTGAHLHGRWLTGARVGWVVAAGLVVALFGASLPVSFEYLRIVCSGEPCIGPQLSVAGAQALEDAGLSVDAFALYGISVAVVFAAVYFALACVIFWHKSDESVALLAALMLVTFGATFPPTVEWLRESDPAWLLPGAVVRSLGLCLFFVFFYIFPDGRFVPSWTRVMVPLMVTIELWASFFPDSPLSYGTWPGPLTALLFLGWFGTVIYAQIYRYRRVSGPVQRQQTKWVVFGVAAALCGFLGVILGSIVLPTEIQQNPFLLSAAGITAPYLFMLLVPLSMAVAILQHRLWEIDLLISRALAYGALTAAVIALYVLLVSVPAALLRTSEHWLLTLPATGVVAILFQPLRERLQRAANRMVYGERDEPYAVLSRLGQRLEATLASDAVLPTIVESVAKALKLPHASIWMVQQDTLRLAAVHGTLPAESVIHDRHTLDAIRGQVDASQDAPQPEAFGVLGNGSARLGSPDPVVLLPLSHAGVLVGALGLAPRSPGEAFSSADRRLLRDLARQGGTAVHAVRLTVALQGSLEELRRSRERLVTAQEEERRRVQRDLHDGLGPTLASMRLRLEACLDMAERPSAPLLEHLTRMHEMVGQTSGDIRRLVHDLRPPALDQMGLVSALRQHCERFGLETGIKVDFQAETGLTVPAAAEVAIFRVVQEALVNVQKHADASKVDVRLRRGGEWLELTMRDDGVGFAADGKAVPSGTGIDSMRERAEMLCGTVRITNHASGGAEVVMLIPDRR